MPLSTPIRTRASVAAAVAVAALAGPASAQDPAPVVPVAPPEAENPLDVTPPRLTLGGRRVQRLARSLEAFGTCDEPCEFDASARVLNVPGLTHLRVVTPGKASAGGTRMRFEIRVSPRAHKLMNSALRDGIRVRVEVVVLAYDFADNETEQARRLRVVPPAPPVRRS
ncbi:MAG: hypothetical protein M3340_04035 [Actinomycetota bacterium]|nr:hypothetical protein [Actinomycetota bacterium]